MAERLEVYKQKEDANTKKKSLVQKAYLTNK